MDAGAVLFSGVTTEEELQFVFILTLFTLAEILRILLIFLEQAVFEEDEKTLMEISGEFKEPRNNSNNAVMSRIDIKVYHSFLCLFS